MGKIKILLRLIVPIHKSAHSICVVIMLIAVLSAVRQAPAASHDKKFSYNYNLLKNKSVGQLDKLGEKYKDGGELDKALLCYTIIAARYNDKVSPSDKNIYCNAYNDIGIIYFTKANYSESFEAFTKASELAGPKALPGIYNNIASLYYYFNDYDNARLYLEKAYKGCIEHGGKNILNNVVRNMIEIGMATGQFKELSKTLREYCKMTAGTKDIEEIFARKLCQGAEYMISKKYDKAIENFNQALAFTGKIRLGKAQEVTVNMYIAQAYSMRGDKEKAINTLKKCEQTAVANSINDMLIDIYKRLDKIYSETGDARKADTYHKKYLELKDSVFSNQELRRMKDFRFTNEVNKYKNHVETLNAANERRSMIITFVSAGLVIVFLMLIWMYRQYMVLKAKNATLYTKNVELLQADNENREARKSFTGKIDALQRRINELESVSAGNDKPGNGKYRGSNLDEYGKNVLIERIRQVFDSPELFCSDDFSLEKLSEEVGSNSRYVSQTINEVLCTNFSTLLNNSRVKEACRRLSDTDVYGNMTLEAIAQSVGFKSRSHFCRIFKNATGLTPSNYQHIAWEQKQKP